MERAVLHTTIEIALAGLTIATRWSGRLKCRTPSPSTSLDEPIFDDWRSETEGVHRAIFRITGDPIRSDPFRIARREVDNYGRGPMESTLGPIELLTVHELAEGEQVPIGLHLGAAHVEDMVGDPSVVKTTGLFPADLTDDATDLRVLAGQLCDSAIRLLRSRDVCWQFRYWSKFEVSYDYAILWNAEDQALTFLQFEAGRWAAAGEFRVGIRQRTFDQR
jgi:hypothetical protein